MITAETIDLEGQWNPAYSKTMTSINHSTEGIIFLSDTTGKFAIYENEKPRYLNLPASTIKSASFDNIFRQADPHSFISEIGADETAWNGKVSIAFVWSTKYFRFIPIEELTHKVEPMSEVREIWQGLSPGHLNRIKEELRENIQRIRSQELDENNIQLLSTLMEKIEKIDKELQSRR